MNPLEQLQGDVTAMLLGNPVTAAVPFTSFRRQVAESLQDEAQAAWKIRVEGKIGVSCLVLMPSVTSLYGNVPGPQFEWELVIRVFEDPVSNNIGLSAEDVGLEVLRWLDGMIIEDLTEVLAARTKGPALRPNYDYPGYLVYDATFEGQLPQDMLSRTAAPEIADDDAGTVTLSCADTSASIYYTISGTMPQLGEEEGDTLVYTAPFVVPDGAAVRAVAWDPSGTKLPSDVVKGVVNVV